jgi:hypothetical protein
MLVGCGGGATSDGSGDMPSDQASTGAAGAESTTATGSGGGSSTQAGTGGNSTQAGTGGSKQMGSGGSGVTGTGGHAGTASMGGAGLSMMGGDGGKGLPTLKCSTAVNSALPATAPALEPGVWKNITPPGIPLGNAQDVIGQGFAIDPCNLSTIYWGTTPFDSAKGGLYKSTDGGGTWKKTGMLDEPLHIRVDPTNPKHLYSGDGVRGATLGFWVSNDGGDTWTKPDGWIAAGKATGFIDDVYDLAVDPTDFKHIIISSHSAWGWDDTKWKRNAGVMESKDGGNTWVAHDPQMTWGAGHSINFLYDPDKGIGDANTWLLGTQGDGQWRTTDAGATWTKVLTNSIFHGGGETYYAKDGKVYSTGVSPCLQRSSDNGATWTPLKATGECTGVWGDGNYLYTAPAYAQGMQPFFTSPETDGLTWTAYKGGTQKFDGSGPYEMAFDSVNGILYASMWFQGVWALKVTP